MGGGGSIWDRLLWKYLRAVKFNSTVTQLRPAVVAYHSTNSTHAESRARPNEMCRDEWKPSPWRFWRRVPWRWNLLPRSRRWGREWRWKESGVDAVKKGAIREVTAVWCAARGRTCSRGVCMLAAPSCTRWAQRSGGSCRHGRGGSGLRGLLVSLWRRTQIRDELQLFILYIKDTIGRFYVTALKPFCSFRLMSWSAASVFLRLALNALSFLKTPPPRGHGAVRLSQRHIRRYLMLPSPSAVPSLFSMTRRPRDSKNFHFHYIKSKKAGAVYKGSKKKTPNKHFQWTSSSRRTILGAPGDPAGILS